MSNINKKENREATENIANPDWNICPKCGSKRTIGYRQGLLGDKMECCDCHHEWFNEFDFGLVEK
jgi:hypothetical protein